MHLLILIIAVASAFVGVLTIYKAIGSSNPLERIIGIFVGSSIILLGGIIAIIGMTNPDTDTATLESEPRIFKIETKPLGSGTVIQTATNAASFMRVGVVRMTSSYGENLLGDRIVLMGSDIKVDDFVLVNRIIVGHERRELYRFPVAEKEKTNKVASAVQQ